MMEYYENILGLIGKTPLVKVSRLADGIKATILAKMESHNPGGSVKDRIGIAMIEAAERDGRLKPGGTIVEATSGNTGIGLALAAAVRGYKSIFVMTEKASVEKGRYLRALGADVVICPVAAKHGSPDHYVTTAKRIAAETPNSFYPDQYSNPSNPDAHYLTTGPELWEQTDGKITHFVAGLGTGGTISGTGRYLKERNPSIRVIGADPYGSIFKAFKETGEVVEATPYMVEGIGQDVVPANVHIEYVDEIINVTDRESFELSRQLGRVEGIFCGGSTGTNLAAALKVARGLDESGVVVFIVCDTGERYLTKHLSDEWMRSKRLLEPQKITAGLLLQTKTSDHPGGLVYAEPSAPIGAVLETMASCSLSLIPILDDGRPVGSARENRLLVRVLQNRDILASPVGDAMDPSFPVVEDEATLPEIVKQLQASPAILVEEYGRIAGILTRHDLLDVPQPN
jgi:cystathionine beta-synthase